MLGWIGLVWFLIYMKWVLLIRIIDLDFVLCVSVFVLLRKVDSLIKCYSSLLFSLLIYCFAWDKIFSNFYFSF